MDKAKITVNLRERQSTKVSSLPPLSPMQANQQEKSSPSTPFITQTHPEAPYLDDWSSWIAHEPMDMYSGVHVKEKAKMMWLQLLMTISGAVITGLCIGIFVMKLFQVETTEQVILPVESEIPTQMYTWIQSGVFQNSESAEKAQSILQKKGFPCYVSSKDTHAVFVGMAMNQAEAEKLRQYFKSMEIEVYQKKIELPACGKACQNPNQGDHFSTLMQHTNQMIRLLYNATIPILTAQSSANSYSETAQQLATTQRALQSLPNDLHTYSHGTVGKMIEILRQATSTWQKHHTNLSPEIARTIQRDMIHVIDLQKQLLESFN